MGGFQLFCQRGVSDRVSMNERKAFKGFLSLERERKQRELCNEQGVQWALKDFLSGWSRASEASGQTGHFWRAEIKCGGR